MRALIVPALILSAMPVALTSDETPGTAAILQLSTSQGFGSACPVSESIAWTARHVIEDGNVAPDWSDGRGNYGDTELASYKTTRDIATLHGTFPDFYAVATEMPKPGDELTILGFEWRKRSAILGRKIVRSRFLRRVGNQLVYDRGAEPGSSGSCVLNSRGQVVGINVWQFDVSGSVETIGLAVSVVGETL